MWNPGMNLALVCGGNDPEPGKRRRPARGRGIGMRDCMTDWRAETLAEMG